MHRILLNCAGSADFVPIIRDFARRSDIELVPADAHPELRLAAVTDRYATLPSGSDARFVDAVLALARQERITMVIPKADEEVFALMRARAQFEAAGIILAIPDDALLPVLPSKSACYAHLARRGFPVPEHRVARTEAEFDVALAAFGYPHRPMLMKPDTARGGRGVCVVADSPDACHEMIPIHDRALAVQLLDGHTPYLCMAYRTGVIYDIDVLRYANGDTFFGARRRFTNVTKFFSGNEFSADPALLAFARRVYEALPSQYLIDYDILVTDDGELVLLEVNPRPSGSTVSYIPFGTNLFYTLAKSYLDDVHLPIAMPPHGATAVVCFDMIARAAQPIPAYAVRTHR